LNEEVDLGRDLEILPELQIREEVDALDRWLATVKRPVPETQVRTRSGSMVVRDDTHIGHRITRCHVADDDLVETVQSSNKVGKSLQIGCISTSVERSEGDDRLTRIAEVVE
jgi:hypothetical protein